MLAAVAVAFALSSTFSPSTQLAARAVADNAVDVELILAVDVSRSMDPEELEVQRSGYIEALRHPDFIAAVRMGLIGKVAISYYEWSGSVDTNTLVDWHVIASAEDAQTFAAAVEAAPLERLYGTSISGAIDFGRGMFDRSGYEATRQVIDISGDGPNNRGQPVVPSRDAALAEGVIINGLAIMIRPSASIVPLDQYYQDCVVGGPGSFVLPVHKAEDFASSIRRKLVLEISGIGPPARVLKTAEEEPSDCMIGEKLRYNFNDR